jgi:circadian clock protein KaiC
MTFLYQGAVEFQEPGVFVAFEERPTDLVTNVGSLHYDIQKLIADKMLAIDHIQIDRNDIEEAGDYDLEALFIRLGFAIDSIGAKRVVIDTIERCSARSTAMPCCDQIGLIQWLKQKGVTAIITGERGDGMLTRHGLEEYVADCVILLDNRVQDQLSTRRLRIVKYRGSAHGTNEYPFIIDEQGITVMPITSSGLAHDASTERSVERHSRPRRDARGQGLLQGFEHSDLGHGRRRQVDDGGAFRRFHLQVRGALHLFRDGRVAATDRAQHALDRVRPAEMGEQGPAQLQCAPSQPLRARSPCCDAPRVMSWIPGGRH